MNYANFMYLEMGPLLYVEIVHSSEKKGITRDDEEKEIIIYTHVCTLIIMYDVIKLCITG